MRPYPDKHHESIRAYLLMRQTAIKGRAELERLESQVTRVRAEVMLAGATDQQINNVRDKLVLEGRLPRSAGEPSMLNRERMARELIIELCGRGKKLADAIRAAQVRTGCRLPYKKAYNAIHGAKIRLGRTKPLTNRELLHRLYYDQGLTYRQIAAVIGCGSSTVSQRMKEYGFEARNPRLAET